MFCSGLLSILKLTVSMSSVDKYAGQEYDGDEKIREAIRKTLALIKEQKEHKSNSIGIPSIPSGFEGKLEISLPWTAVFAADFLDAGRNFIVYLLLPYMCACCEGSETGKPDSKVPCCSRPAYELCLHSAH